MKLILVEEKKRAWKRGSTTEIFHIILINVHFGELAQKRIKIKTKNCSKVTTVEQTQGTQCEMSPSIGSDVAM